MKGHVPSSPSRLPAALLLFCIFALGVYLLSSSSASTSTSSHTAVAAVAASTPSPKSSIDLAAEAFAKAQQHEIARDGIDDTVTAVVECATSAGNVTIDVRSGWSPRGAGQFLELVDLGLFSDLPFTRVCPKYIAQYGRRHGYRLPPHVRVIADDPPMWGKRDMDFGYVFFAGSGRDSRMDEMVTALCDQRGCRQSGLGKVIRC